MSAKMSKAELLAIKAKRKAQRQANNQAPAQRPLDPPPKPSGNHIQSHPLQQVPLAQSRAQQPAPAEQSAAAAGREKVVSKQQPSTGADPELDVVPVRSSGPKANAPVTANVTGADGASALPKGFFDDKKSDAIAQGEKPRTAADAEKDLRAFQREVDQLEEQQIAVAAEEAEEAAERAAAQEELEDKQRMAELEALKKRQRVGKVDERTLSLIKRAREEDAAATGTSIKSGAPGPGKGGEQEQDSEDDSDDDLDDDVLGSIAVDWRAKR